MRQSARRRSWLDLALALALCLLLSLPAGCSAPNPSIVNSPTPVSASLRPPEAAAPGKEPAATPTPDTEGPAATGETGVGDPGETPEIVLPTTEPAAMPTPRATTTAANPAAPRKRIIALDPGHGGPETGAVADDLVEKDVNLKIGLKLAALLRAGDYDVVLTRDADRTVHPEYKGGGYRGGVVLDLQARVDIANRAGADLFLSLHNNGSDDPSQSGTEVWYDKERSFGDRNLALAKLVEEALVAHIRELGYPVVARGVKDDSSFRVYRGRVYNIFVLGPGTGAREHAPTAMPGVLGESLFVSHPGDAAMLRKERTLDAIAAGYRDAIVAYFERYRE